MYTIKQVRDIYARTAPRYDGLVRIFPLLGARMGHYRRQAVSALALGRGDTVVELGCGTGLNFALLHEAVGAEGRIIGVDLTPEMLQRARERVARKGWTNVELVRCDVAEFPFPARVSAVLSTFALTLSPDYDDVVRRAASALAPDARFVLLDLKRPTAWPAWLARLAAWLNRPFAVTVDLGERRPWESLRAHLRELEFREHFAGAVYRCVAEQQDPRHGPAAGDGHTLPVRSSPGT